jgi:IclR family transcriptional regulator, KDG regulon repressor
MSEESCDYNVRAIERAARILACFEGKNGPISSSEIAQTVGLHKSTTHRILATLAHFGLVERASDGRNYQLGLRLASLGYRVIQGMDVRREAIPVMTRLRDEWNESCDLSIFHDNRVFYVEVLQSNHALRIAAHVGRHLPAHCTASGKMFLASMSPENLEGFLARPLHAYGKNTLTSPEELRDHLRQIREQGYSVDAEEFELGVTAVAAPVRDRSGAMIAALSIPGPASRMTPAHITEISSAVIEGSRSISLRLGFRG